MRYRGVGFDLKFIMGGLAVVAIASCTPLKTIPLVPETVDGGGTGGSGGGTTSGGGGTTSGGGGSAGSAGGVAGSKGTGGTTTGGSGGRGAGGSVDGGGAAGRMADAGSNDGAADVTLGPAVLGLDSTSYNFGSVEVGGTGAAATFLLGNGGGTASGRITVSLTGGASGFSLTSDTCSGVTLAAGASCRITVTLVATTAGALNAALNVSAQPGGSVSATLQATALSAGMVQVNPRSQDFGAVGPNLSSATQVFMVSNAGQQPTGRLAVTLGGTDATQFQLTADTCSGVMLAALGACQVTVRFAPTASGARSASLTVTGTPGGSAIAQLAGLGQRPAALSATPAAIALGNVEVGVGVAATVVISNTGDATAARIPTVTSTASELAITSNGCTTVLAGGATCTIRVTFTPAAGGARSQQLSVSDATSSLLIPVTANGVYRLTVVRAGTGTGTVTSVPAGISCGTTCTAVVGGPGTMVTLTARPTNGSSSLFSGWSGGGCTGIGRECAVTLAGSTTVTATFSPYTANLVFFTSTPVTCNRGSAAAYDTECNAAATEAGINDSSGTAFTAVTSDAVGNVRNRLGASANGWVRLDGLPFADTQASLFMNQAIFYPIRFNETGVAEGDVQLMTGSNPDGTVARNCLNWTTTSDIALEGGLGSVGPSAWIAGATSACSVTYGRVMCMGHTRNVVVRPPAVTGARKVWLTNTLVSIMPGSSVDSLCQASRPTGVSTAAALISHPNLAASSLVDPAMTYVRVDNAVVGTGAKLAAAAELQTGIWQSASGLYGLTAGAWTGTTSPSLFGALAATCGDWSDPTSTAAVIMGSVTRTNPTWWNLGQISSACMSANTVYCIQTAP